MQKSIKFSQVSPVIGSKVHPAFAISHNSKHIKKVSKLSKAIGINQVPLNLCLKDNILGQILSSTSLNSQSTNASAEVHLTCLSSLKKDIVKQARLQAAGLSSFRSEARSLLKIHKIAPSTIRRSKKLNAKKTNLVEKNKLIISIPFQLSE